MTILIENGAVLSLPQGKLIVHNPGYVFTRERQIAAVGADNPPDELAPGRRSDH